MTISSQDQSFVGRVPRVYEDVLVPLLFAPYAADLAGRVARHRPGRVLELAAGTGALTRALAAVLPDTAEVLATDLNPPMLEQAARAGTPRGVTWQPADAAHLPAADAGRDVVVCQFGVMFFPDKPAALAEAHRVLRPGGHLLFNVWDALAGNGFTQAAHDALAAHYGVDAPSFFARVPYAYHDPAVIAGHLAAAGFTATPTVTVMELPSRAASAHAVAQGLCHGTPLRDEIEALHPGDLSAATDVVAAAVARQYGDGPVEGRMRALVIEVTR
ncbi:SAM-dependent methyltransferase [Deinococcus metalli]|uniref:SAM-dependent methyltransferase n=1 Tax=Deinococcus metalli TaxID=1141878 RepID=A0A7W8KAI3_9DEIO|nr:methyltransferase domain-containing protein [Deinococcus metalli]MBB5374694.1 SAM-dependent methyltransferase [Deinococcus metalli]GHF34394.1 ubiquinone/menaquinone biosynthesis methyltransferase [Deinococcus metalli]